MSNIGNTNILEYKGYYGSVEFSLADGVLFGKVQGIKSLISYEGKTLPDLYEDFCGAIDDYLEMCRAEGIVPEKAFKGCFNVRLAPDIHKRAFMAASSKGISLNSFVEESIRHSLEMSGD